MQRIILGKSGLNVPVFAVGTAPLHHVPRESALSVLHRAYELGATWWDTSDDYGTEALVADALPHIERRLLTISTKTSAATYEDGERAVTNALTNLRVDAVDIMYLHFVQDAVDFENRRGCLNALRDARTQGKVRAIGLSSHHPDPFHLAAAEPEIDVIFAPWNSYGEMPDGQNSKREMEEAIRACYAARKGVVLMKLLNAGRLKTHLVDALHAGAAFREKHAVCIGVTSILELETDIRLVLNQPVDASIIRFLTTGRSDGREAA